MVDTTGAMGGGGADEMWECGFEGVVRAEDIDVDDGFHSVGGELGDGGEEISCCACSI